MDFADSSYSNIICVEAAFHFNTREQFLRDAYRVLKPSGRLVMADALAPSFAPGQLAENFLPSIDAYRALCEQCGFRDVDIEDVTIPVLEGCAWASQRFFDEKLRSGEITRP